MKREILRLCFAHALDAFARPELSLLRRPVCSFHLCGGVGLALAVALGMTLATHLGLSPRVLGVLVTTSFATFVALALVTKVVTGEERLIYYHHEIAILLTSALTLHLLDLPILPYLDVVILGVGLFLACGRVGCLMVGCCHGRPHPWGVTYRAKHAEAGFPQHLVGVRLFPVQALEALFVFATVAAGSLLVWSGRPPGEALAIYVFAYGGARFVFEFVRGDADRPYLLGFSEAQWTSLALMTASVVAAWRGDLPLPRLAAGATASVVLVMAGVAWKRRRDPGRRHELLHARHVSELAIALRDGVTNGPSAARPVPLIETSRGLRISGQRLPGDGGPVDHYCLSSAGRPMRSAAAAAAAGLILSLRPGDGPRELVRGAAGVFHLLVHAQEERAEPPGVLTGAEAGVR